MVTAVAGRDGTPFEVPESAIETLAAGLGGSLLRPGEPGFGASARLWNGMIHKTPALVVQPTTARDVVSVVRFAREREILLSVKGGGHNIAGTAVADGGLTEVRTSRGWAPCWRSRPGTRCSFCGAARIGAYDGR
jgi:hypothetical protein